MVPPSKIWIPARSLISNGVDLIVIDTATDIVMKVLKTLSKVKKIIKNVPVCVGNIATGEAAKKLYNSGADIIKVLNTRFYLYYKNGNLSVCHKYLLLWRLKKLSKKKILK